MALPPGEGQAILKFDRQTPFGIYDDAGALGPVDVGGGDSAVSLFVENGLNDRFTLQGKWEARRKADDFVDYEGSGPAVLHVLPQRLVHRELGHLRALGTPIRVPLRGRRSILEYVTTGCGVAAQLPRDRRRRTDQPSSDLAHPTLLGVEDGNLLALTDDR